MSKIGAVILAAGMSKRMGKPKLLLKLNGVPLVHYPIALARHNSLHPIIVIAGQYLQDIKKEMAGLNNVNYLYNPQYESGMASSLKLGIQAVRNYVDAVFVFLGDQPFVPDEVIQALVKEYEIHKEKGVRIIRPRYEGELGHPVLFDNSLFEQFNAIHGDEGGRRVIQNNKEKLKLVDFPHHYWGMDIDTPEDYQVMSRRHPV